MPLQTPSSASSIGAYEPPLSTPPAIKTRERRAGPRVERRRARRDAGHLAHDPRIGRVADRQIRRALEVPDPALHVGVILERAEPIEVILGDVREHAGAAAERGTVLEHER